MSHGLCGKIRLVVIQPSPFCNIDCRYCYLPNRGSTAIIEERTLAKIFERLFESAYLEESVTLLWHAGEPLSVPTDFYENAFSLLARFNQKHIHVQQALQTNATLITQEWCDFFKAHRVQVSVSIDGPQDLHDANRISRSGRGTFERAMRGVKLLAKNDIPVSNIAVLTSEALDHPTEIWELFLGQGMTRLCFNVDETEGAHTQSSLHSPEDIERYQTFFRRLRELRNTSDRKVFIRELDNMERRVRCVDGSLENQLNLPMSTVSFDYRGNISTFSPELLAAQHGNKYSQLTFGNVFTCGVDDILASPQFCAVNDDIQRGVAKCRQTCPYFSVCGGGEPSTKLAENGTFDSTETMHCRLTIQALCQVVLEGVEERLGIANASSERA
jgi:uncharacterized protein